MRGVFKKLTPIRFHWSVIALFALIPIVTFFTHGFDFDTVVHRAAVASLIYLSFIAHEMGHLVVGLAHGCRTYRINVYAHTSASVAFRHSNNLRAAVLISLAGPITSILASLIALLLNHFNIPYSFEAFVINAAIGIYNLIPAYPLDGGKILKALIRSHTGNPRQASLIAIKISVLIVVLGLLLSIIYRSLSILCFSIMLAGSVWSSVVRYKKVWEKIDSLYG